MLRYAKILLTQNYYITILLITRLIEYFVFIIWLYSFLIELLYYNFKNRKYIVNCNLAKKNS